IVHARSLLRLLRPLQGWFRACGQGLWTKRLASVAERLHSVCGPRGDHMLLNAERSQLLIIDLQERLLPAMHHGDAIVERCAILLQAAQELSVPATISEQYRKGLGATVARLDNAKGAAPVMAKMHFSCAADPAI